MGGDGERLALIGASGTVSYGDLGLLVAETAAGLRRRGVGPGRVVALALGSTPDLVVALLGTWAAGGCALPLNAHWWPRETTAVLDAVAPDLVLRTPGFALGDHVPALVAGRAGRSTNEPAGVVDIDPGDGLASLLSGVREPLASPAPDLHLASDLAGLVAEGAELWAATTGCTGEPRTFAFDGDQLRERWLVPLPESPASVACWTDAAHPPTLRLLLGALAGGARVHLTDRWAPRRALSALGERPVDLLWATAPQLARAVRSPRAAGDGRLADRIVAVGGPLHPPVADRVRRRFGGQVTVRYTSTEAGGWVTAGAPAPGVENGRSPETPPHAAAAGGPTGRAVGTGVDTATGGDGDGIAGTSQEARGVATGPPAPGVGLAIQPVGVVEAVEPVDEATPSPDAATPPADDDPPRGLDVANAAITVGQLHVGGPASASRTGGRDGRPRPADGWPTGDLVEVGASGEVWLLGRLADSFVTDGQHVVPLEVEVALGRDPRLAEVVVVARPDAVRGAIGVAVTVPADPEAPPFLADLETRLAELPAGCRPAAQCVIGELPLSAAGHVHRRLLAFEEASR